MEEGGRSLDVAALLRALERGEECPEGQIVRALRSPACPGRLPELLAHLQWVRESRRIPALMVRHPSCPKFFAMQALLHLGWHDLLLTARDPRTNPAIRRQAERRLTERLRDLSIGERTALARRAPRALIAALLADPAPGCVAALLMNPQFQEGDAVRLARSNRSAACILALLHHPRWGRSREVALAALSSPVVPLGVALGLAATLGDRELRNLARSAEASDTLRAAARDLLERRRAPLALCDTASKLCPNDSAGQLRPQGVRRGDPSPA
jgi:hypothetical protein